MPAYELNPNDKAIDILYILSCKATSSKCCVGLLKETTHFGKLKFTVER